MNWDEVWKIVLGILTSFGGIVGIVTIAIKFSCNMIAKRLEERYTLKINKELEKYKSNLDNKIYISKTKFDTEFSIYRELSKSYAEMVKGISLMIPTGMAKYPANKDEKKEYENRVYDKALTATIVAQDVLNQNIPFISSNLFNEYDNILNLCRRQLDVFERRWDVGSLVTQDEKESFSMEDYECTSEIREKFKELNENIRRYLSTLDVMD